MSDKIKRLEKSVEELQSLNLNLKKYNEQLNEQILNERKVHLDKITMLNELCQQRAITVDALSKALAAVCELVKKTY